MGGRRFVKQQQIRRLSSPTRTDLTSLINSEKDSERRISPYFCANMIQSASDSDIARLWLGCRSPLARHPSRSADQLQNTARLWTCAFRVPPSESRDAPGVGRSSNPPPPLLLRRRRWHLGGPWCGRRKPRRRRRRQGRRRGSPSPCRSERCGDAEPRVTPAASHGWSSQVTAAHAPHDAQ